MFRKLVTSIAFTIAAVAFVTPVALAGDRPDSEDGQTRCELEFTLKSWSAFYRSSRGSGRITCDNGQSAPVMLRAHSGGLTFGKTEVKNGTGQFTLVRDIKEVFGAYASTEAHGGAARSGDAKAMTKGEVSLAIKGTGNGFDLGFAFGKFSIKPVDPAPGTATTDQAPPRRGTPRT